MAKIVITSKLKNANKKLKNYEILTNTYDQRLASIQTIIIISTTFASAIIVALCTKFNLLNLLNFSLIKINGKIPNTKQELIGICILSGIAMFQNLCCTISIIDMALGCEKMRKELYLMEVELFLNEMHAKNHIIVSLILTVFCTFSITVVFLLIFIKSIMLIY